MLAIITPSRFYVNDLLEKLNYSKELSPKMSELYKCNYKEHEFIILVTGYGKVNIGSSLRYACMKYNVKAVVLMGTAGSIKDGNDIFSSIVPVSTLQFDVDFMPNGYGTGQIPMLEKALYKTNDDLKECLIRASSIAGISYNDDILASSDTFVTNYNLASSIRREYNAGAVDCEAGAVGEFCYVNNISYACIKVISNFANNNGIKQCNLYDEESSKICQRIMNKFLKEFYEA